MIFFNEISWVSKFYFQNLEIGIELVLKIRHVSADIISGWRTNDVVWTPVNRRNKARFRVMMRENSCHVSVVYPFKDRKKWTNHMGLIRPLFPHYDRNPAWNPTNIWSEMMNKTRSALSKDMVTQSFNLFLSVSCLWASISRVNSSKRDGFIVREN